MLSELTHVSLLTPIGRGAIATVLVRGNEAAKQVAQHFVAASGRPWHQGQQDRFVFGRWYSQGDAGEEVILRHRDEDTIEIHCHGGHAAATAIIQSLIGEGCRPIDWPQSVVHDEPDPIRADALIALAQAQTERTARILLDQYHGALREMLERILTKLQPTTWDEAAGHLHELLRLAPIGLHLTTPWKVMLAGPPNVGKSSLVNALVGYRRAIVYESPGTTRDVVTAATAIDGWPVELSDTAGLRGSFDTTEAAGITLAQNRLPEADLVVLVFDASQRWSSANADLTSKWPEALIVHSKHDLVSSRLSDRPPGLNTSAVTGTGVDDLLNEFSRRLVGHPSPPGTAIPFLNRHVDVLQQVSQAVESGNEVASREWLRGLLTRRSDSG